MDGCAAKNTQWVIDNQFMKDNVAGQLLPTADVVQGKDGQCPKNDKCGDKNTSVFVTDRLLCI